MCMDFIHSPFPETSFRFRVNFRSLKKPDLPSVTMKIKRLSRENPMVMHTMRRMELTAGRFLFLIHRIRYCAGKGNRWRTYIKSGFTGGKNDLKLVGDLGFESQPDDFGQVLGYQLTNYVSMSNYTSYEWYFEDEGYYTSLQAQYGEDGKLSTVWLMNNADLRK